MLSEVGLMGKGTDHMISLEWDIKQKATNKMNSQTQTTPEGQGGRREDEQDNGAQTLGVKVDWAMGGGYMRNTI